MYSLKSKFSLNALSQIFIIIGLMLVGIVQATEPVTEPKTEAKATSETTKAPEKTLTQNTKVILKTSQGDIILALEDDKAPISVDNFKEYVNNKHYDGLIFHRVIPNFMIQGGGFTETMMKKPTRAPIINEAHNGLKNQRGTVAMARLRAKDSATAQFYINLVDNQFLNHKAQGYGYAVFGKVVEGMDVVDSIANVRTGMRGDYRDVPHEPIIIHEAKILSEPTQER